MHIRRSHLGDTLGAGRGNHVRVGLANFLASLIGRNPEAEDTIPVATEKLRRQDVSCIPERIGKRSSIEYGDGSSAG